MITHPAQEKGFQRLLDVVVDAALVIDEHGNSVTLNPEAERLRQTP